LREISPALNATADQFFATLQPPLMALVTDIRQQKARGSRMRPSVVLIDNSGLLSAKGRTTLVDKVAELVDENLCGRGEMCEQYAVLLALALDHLGIQARPVSGEAIYFDAQGKEIYRWRHVWVRVGDELIDGNVDSLVENPAVPKTVQIAPYWGPIQATPRDRKLSGSGARIGPDNDVIGIWWPDLKKWLDGPFAILAENT